MGDILVEAPATEPVSADELRAHLRDCADADAVLEVLIGAAREYFEEATGLAMIEQTRLLTLDYWPSGSTGRDDWWDGVQDGSIMGDAPRALELPRGPLISIDHVKTANNDGTLITYGSTNYFADTGRRPGRLALVPGAVWPVPERTASGIQIQYKAGHEAVPNAFKVAILQIAAHWYENRELVDLEGPGKVPMQAERIISKFRIVKL